ncbi:MAG: 3-oxoacyl-[acyl-carrier-protein] reductase [Bacillota bacterium]|nr:3-oxoacyl-[acyl-carrier-protein] reductase [Bacillota bacterium]HHU60647.1 3-oxoacyl-[acyl-carrier-protein] reductase [Natronincola sp.]
MNMLGKVALITGATRGIGKAIAEKLHANGAEIVVTGRNPELLKLWEAKGALAVSADVTQVSEVQNLIELTLKKYGKLDVVVNNAGITRDGLLMRTSDDDWNQVISTNLTGVFNVCKAAIRPMLKQRQGKIVNISSVIGVSGNAGQTNYAASKAGVIGFSKSLAKEVAGRNILVNIVAPGYIDTDMTEALTETQRDEIIKMIPLKRTGLPEDIASLVNFLVSDENKYITGQTIHCDGGLVI